MAEQTIKIPEPLEDYKQWVMWKYEDRGGKLTKVPYTVDGKRASSTDSKTWNSVDVALAALGTNNFDGIGFVFSRHDPFIGIDWDHCLHPNKTWIDGKVAEEVYSFKSYAEVSPSGTGVHCICIGKIPDGSRCRSGNKEMYASGRFFTFTGNRLEFCPEHISVSPEQAIIDFVSSLAPTKTPQLCVSGNNVVVSYKTMPTTKEKVTEVVNKCKNGKYAKKFKKLFHGDWSDYHSQSEADFSLCYIIARYTNNPTDIDVIFRKSKLFRDKWNNGYYRTRTLNQAMTAALVSAIEDVVEE